MGVKFLEPLQNQLLNRGMCVACLMPLTKAERNDRGDGTELVICKCKRAFVYDKKKKSYRRAELNEI